MTVVVRDGNPHRDVPSVVDEFCLHVKLSPHRSLFVASPNLATSQPGHGVFACLLMAPEGRRAWGMSPTGKCLPLGLDSSMKISANFIHFYPLKKPYFCSIWRGPPSRWPSSEHCSTEMGSLDIDQHCVPVSQLLIPHQNSTSTCFSKA